ncbi:flagellar hook-length control protein FliK [Aquabacterium sp.]|uniref:flagellar hook-length control protein FliK n=1 Tax=Aquabacterium sp. TaxID=1872578 RepID=UPI0037840FA2
MASPLIPFSPTNSAGLVTARNGAGMPAAADTSAEPGAFAQAFQRSSEALQAPTVTPPSRRSPHGDTAGPRRDAPNDTAGAAARSPDAAGSGSAAQDSRTAAMASDGDTPPPDTTTDTPLGEPARGRHAQRRAGSQASQAVADARPRTPRGADADEGAEAPAADGLPADRPADTEDRTIAEDIGLAAGILPSATTTPTPAMPSTLSLQTRSTAADDASSGLPSAAATGSASATATLAADALPAAALPTSSANPAAGNDPAAAHTSRRTAGPGLSRDEASALGARRLPLAGTERAVPAPASGQAEAAPAASTTAAGNAPSEASRTPDLRRAGTAADQPVVDAAPTSSDATADAASTAGDGSAAAAADASTAAPTVPLPALALPAAPQGPAGTAARGLADAPPERAGRGSERGGIAASDPLTRTALDPLAPARGESRGPRSAAAGRGTDTEAGRGPRQARTANRSDASDDASAANTATTASATAVTASRGDDARGDQPGAASSADAAAGSTSAAPSGTGSSVRFADALQNLMPGASPGVPAAASSPQASATPLPTSHLGAHLNSPEFAPSLGAQITLLARQGVQQARIELNPADMGPITVRIAVAGSGAQVDFQADRAATRQVIESSLPALAGALRESGLTLTGGGVFQPPADGSSLGGSFAQNFGGQGQGGPGGNASGPSPGASGAPGGRPGWPGGDDRDLPGSTTVLRTGLPRGLVDLVA